MLKISSMHLTHPPIHKLASTQTATFFLALLCAGSSITSAWAGPDGKQVRDGKEVIDPCEAIVRVVRERITADPAKAARLVVAEMRAHEDCACEIARGALESIPVKDRKPDGQLIAAVLRASVVTIYQDIPEARDCVRDLVLAAVDVADDDPRVVAQVVGAALQVIVAYEPALVDPLVQAVNRQVPAAAPLLAEIRANLLLPVALGPGGIRLENKVIEPNFTNVLPPGTPGLDTITGGPDVVEAATDF